MTADDPNAPRSDEPGPDGSGPDASGRGPKSPDAEAAPDQDATPGGDATPDGDAPRGEDDDGWGADSSGLEDLLGAPPPPPETPEKMAESRPVPIWAFDISADGTVSKLVDIDAPMPADDGAGGASALGQALAAGLGAGIGTRPAPASPAGPGVAGIAGVSPEPLPAQAIAWRWIHLDGNAKETKTWVRRRAGIPKLAAQAMLAQETRPRSVSARGGAMVILRGVNLAAGAEPEDMVSVRVWVEATRVISVGLRPLATVKDIAKAMGKGRAPRSPGAFLADIAHGVTWRVGPVLDELDDRIAAMEETAALEMISDDAELAGRDDPATRNPMPSVRASRAELADIRRVAIPLRRYLAPMRDALADLRRMQGAPFSDLDQAMLAETNDRLTHYIEDLDAMRERTQLLAEEASSRAEERMNRAMYALSIITAIFMPLGFLTGLLGVNLGGIPGGGDSWGFLTFCLMLVGLVAFEVWLVRRLKLL